jgi:hypothetical protein
MGGEAAGVWTVMAASTLLVVMQDSWMEVCV